MFNIKIKLKKYSRTCPPDCNPCLLRVPYCCPWLWIFHECTDKEHTHTATMGRRQLARPRSTILATLSQHVSCQTQHFAEWRSRCLRPAGSERYYLLRYKGRQASPVRMQHTIWRARRGNEKVCKAAEWALDAKCVVTSANRLGAQSRALAHSILSPPRSIFQINDYMDFLLWR